VSKKTEKRTPAKKPRAALVVVAGESPMVEELAAVCLRHGYAVRAAINQNPSSRSTLPAVSLSSGGAILKSASVVIEVTNVAAEIKRANLRRIDALLPSTAPILSSSVTVSATEQASWIQHKHRLVGMGFLPGLADVPLVEVAPTVFSPPATVEVVTRFLASLGKATEIVQDRVGLVFPRVICQMVNEAAFAIAEDVAGPRDIDEALKLALNHPRGPIEWAERVGLQQVLGVLTALQREHGGERYRIAPLLRQMSYAGEWWK